MTQKKSAPAHAAEPENTRQHASAHSPQRELPDEPAPKKAAAPKKTVNINPPKKKDIKQNSTVKYSFQKKTVIPKVIRWIVAILLVIALAMVIWTYRANLTPSKIKNWVQTNLLGYNDGSGYPVTLTDSSIRFQNFLVEDGEPASVSGTTFLYLSKGGKTIALRQHGYTTPVMKRSGDSFLIYDLGNKSYRVSTNGTDFTESVNEYQIFCGAIGKNGSYAVAGASDGYTSEMKVYDRNGLKLFEWASQHYLISSVAFSPNGKYIAASGFASDAGSLKTLITVFAFDQTEPVTSYTLDGCVMLDIIFNDNSNVTAVGDTLAAHLSLNGDAKVYDYEGFSLSAYDLSAENGAVLALSASSDGRSGSLVRLDSDFTAHSVTRFEQTVDSIQLYDDYIAMLADGQLTVMDNAGTAVFTADAGVDAIKAQCSKGVCYILGTGEIRSVVLKLSSED